MTRNVETFERSDIELKIYLRYTFWVITIHGSYTIVLSYNM